MLKNQKFKLSCKTIVAAVTAILLCNVVTAQAGLPNAACDSLTQTRIEKFRTKTSGAIALLDEAYSQGKAAAGGWIDSAQLHNIANEIDVSAFGPTTCKTLFYPNSSEFGPSAGAADPNNIHACFRVHVTPQLEYAMYLATLNVWYNNKNDYLTTSYASAKDAFNTVSDLLRKSREISNDAMTCLLESTNANDTALIGP